MKTQVGRQEKRAFELAGDEKIVAESKAAPNGKIESIKLIGKAKKFDGSLKSV
ncbi:MAG: hypothetical protein V4609_02320 [Pseudomonadota bacterium]